MKKISKMNEAGWALGILLCTLGVALCTKASFGLSMIAAPIYIIHIKMVRFFPWHTQGISEYIFQTAIILLTVIVCRRFRLKYALSFITAILSGFALDFWFFLLGGNGMYQALSVRVIAFIVGECTTALAIAFSSAQKCPFRAMSCWLGKLPANTKLISTRLSL